MPAAENRLSPSPPRWHGVLLILLALVAVGRTVGNDFLTWDDTETIAENPSLNPPTMAGVLDYWKRPAMSLYVPLTYTTWGALARVAWLETPDAAGHQLNPAVFHLANVVLHAIAALLAWRILLQLRLPPAAALLGAAVFATHPIQVEAVAWASGTKDVQSAAFALGAILLWLRADQQVARRAHFLAVVPALLCFVAAMLSKPAAMALPAMLLVLSVLVNRRPWRETPTRLLPWFALSIACALLTARVQPPITRNVPTLLARPLIAADAVGFYLAKLIVPWPLQFDYGRTPARVIGERLFLWTLPLAVAAGVAIAFLGRLRFHQSGGGSQPPQPVTAAEDSRRSSGALTAPPTLLAGAIVALFAISPVLGFVPFTFQAFSTTADHYLYPAMIGVALIVANAFAPMRSRAAWTIAACVIAVYAALSFVQSGTWRDTPTLAAHALTVNPRSAVSHTNWAAALTRAGDFAAAETHLLAAVEIDPDDAFAQLSLGQLALSRGEGSAAVNRFERVLAIYRRQQNTDDRLAAATANLFAAKLRAAGFAAEADRLRRGGGR